VWISTPDFNLSATLECGQVFRWDKAAANEYIGVIGRSIVELKQNKNRLYAQASGASITPSFITSYLDLTLDLPYIYNRIGRDNIIKAAIEKYGGLRIIRQPLWECLASFIISTYNNIPRIKGIIASISRCWGKRLVFRGQEAYSFPAPDVFAGLGISRLRYCGAGFRAGFLSSAARRFLDKKMTAESLKEGSYAEARKALMEFDGVGPKVADCVLLYAAGRFEAFPVDVWIKRLMEEFYFGGKKTPEDRIRAFAAGYFGEYAGYAQQYLYHWGRTR
jgi:N-glycosylase/DNA lyase